MIRLGLCCIFREEPIRFRSTTAKALSRFDRVDQFSRLSEVCLHNSESLLASLDFAARNGIGAFRILSPFLPRYTHPDVGYGIDDLPASEAIFGNLEKARDFAERNNIRLSFHPDQFIVLGSPRAEVVESARRELEYQGMLAELVGAEVINVHVGGAYGDKEQALARFAKNADTLSERTRNRLSVENDDITYSVADLLQMIDKTGIPVVYDVHHHRCNPDGMSVEVATSLAVATWQRLGREPYFHISSPRNGWGKGNPKPHADYIDLADFPACWLKYDATVDVEAKAKELAVLRLMGELQSGKVAKGK